MGQCISRNKLLAVWILAGEILGFFDMTTGCCCVLLLFSLSVITQSSRRMQCGSRSLKCFNKESGLGLCFNSGDTQVSGFTKDIQAQLCAQELMLPLLPHSCFLWAQQYEDSWQSWVGIFFFKQFDTVTHGP